LSGLIHEVPSGRSIDASSIFEQIMRRLLTLGVHQFLALLLTHVFPDDDLQAELKVTPNSNSLKLPRRTHALGLVPQWQ
jgi:hypothetical protein